MRYLIKGNKSNNNNEIILKLPEKRYFIIFSVRD